MIVDPVPKNVTIFPPFKLEQMFKQRCSETDVTVYGFAPVAVLGNTCRKAVMVVRFADAPETFRLSSNIKEAYTKEALLYHRPPFCFLHSPFHLPPNECLYLDTNGGVWVGKDLNPPVVESLEPPAFICLLQNSRAWRFSKFWEGKIKVRGTVVDVKDD